MWVNYTVHGSYGKVLVYFEGLGSQQTGSKSLTEELHSFQNPPVSEPESMNIRIKVTCIHIKHVSLK